MPHLLVNLDDLADCEKGMQVLMRRLERGGCPPDGRGRHRMPARGRGPREDEPREHGPREHGPGARPAGPWADEGRGLPAARQDSEIASLPLPQKLKRIQSRGMWKHLVKIARSAQDPLSLPELDRLLDLPKNKMRSLKAIMAKLENRFGIKFLKVDEEAGVDAAGNPRYIMLPNVRRHVLRLAGELSG